MTQRDANERDSVQELKNAWANLLDVLKTEKPTSYVWRFANFLIDMAKCEGVRQD